MNKGSREGTILEKLLKRFLEIYCIVCKLKMDPGVGGVQEDSCKQGEFLGSSERLLASEEVAVSWSHCSVQEAAQVSKIAEWLNSGAQKHLMYEK